MSDMIDSTNLLALLPRIWRTHSLGAIRSLNRPARGSVNPCYVVNEAQVIRFNAAPLRGPARFVTEQRAYEMLQGSGLPVPQVLALDTTRRLSPHDYLIISCMPGSTIVDSWQELHTDQRQQLARSTGEALAGIHAHTLPDFGKLHVNPRDRYDRWSGYVADHYRRYASPAQNLRAIDGSLRQRLDALVSACQPLLDTVMQASLVHSDYHFENVLQRDGHLTAILDFEWAFAADPSWDFIFEDQWEADCPGSSAMVRAGYESLRPLDAQHTTRLLLYKIILNLEKLVEHAQLQQLASVERVRQSIISYADQLAAALSPHPG